MRLTKLAPAFEMCGIGACPAVFRTEAGAYVIVGNSVDRAELPPGQVGDGEFAIEIPKELIEEALAGDK